MPYTVNVRNAGDVASLTNVVITDQLPPGMRYQPSSARLDSGTSVEPEISADGLTLTFRLPLLEARRSVALRYVAVIAAGAAGSTLVNRAAASADGGNESNSASAAVLLREELFSSAGLVLGRVFAGTCETTVDAGAGVAGVRVYLEDGRYAVTDDEGKYHFEGVTPGSHVVQLDTITLPEKFEPLRCDTRVRSAGNATSQFVDLRGGALGTADFVVSERAAPTGDARLTLATAEAPSGFAHTATVTARTVPLQEAELLVLLPDGLEYVPGSAARDGTPAANPETQNGSLRFALGDVTADGALIMSFATRGAGRPVGDQPVQALLRFTTVLGKAERTVPIANVVHREESLVERVSYTFSPRYNAYSFAPRFASLQTQIDARDGAELDRVAADWRGMRELTIRVLGHADQTPIAARNRGRFPDNYALSAARAQAVADYLHAALPEARIEVEGRGADEPITSGTEPDGLARNRRVEIEVAGVRTLASAEWRIVTAEAESAAVATTGAIGGAPEMPRRALASARSRVLTALEPEIDVATLEPRVAFLQPSESFAPPVPTVRVAVAHLPGQEVRLALNGRPVSTLNFDGTEPNAAKTAALSRWRGVDLVAGENRLVATVLDGAGTEVAVLERTVRYGGGAVRAELVAEQSQLTADGRTQPVIALRVFDAAGEPARPGTLGAYRVDPPYRTWWEVETLHDNPLLVESSREPTFAVDDDGLVRILLEPTAQTGTVVVHLRFNERQEQEIRARLAPEQRDWILVGIAEGTAAYDDLSGALEPPGVEDGYSNDGRLAFFAKGRIKGSALLTIAFDSERDRPIVEDRLFGTIEPDRYYTLYGDAVEQRFEAATTRKLYLKLERDELAALFGDFETGFTITELGRYSRSLTGFKADYGGERFAVNAFAAENRERYGRDELQGDGTSGPYRLSRTPLVANSDRLRLEVRDRVRSEVVVESRELVRFIDYSLDYFTGLLTFKQPIPSRDGAFNPVYVIAEYETLDGELGGTTAGARATAQLAGDKLELGATLIGEGADAGDTHLTGHGPALPAERRPRAARRGRAQLLRRPAAHGERFGLSRRGGARHRAARPQAYVREQDAGFGVGQQLRTESGTRKVGVDTRGRAQRALDGARRSVPADEPANGCRPRARVGRGAPRKRRRDCKRGRAPRRRRPAGERRAALGAHERRRQPRRAERPRDAACLDGAVARQPRREPRFSRAHDARARLPPGGLDDVVRRGGGRRRRADRLDDDARRRAQHAVVGLAGVIQRQPRIQRIRPARVRERRAHAELHAWARPGRWTSASTAATRSRAAHGRAFQRERAACLGLHRRRLPRDVLRRAVPRRRVDDHVAHRAARRRRSRSASRSRRLFPRAHRRPRVVGDDALARQRAGDRRNGRTRRRAASRTPYRPRDGRFIVLERLDLVQDERIDAHDELRDDAVRQQRQSALAVRRQLELGTQLGARYMKSTIDRERYSGWSTLLGLDTAPRPDAHARFRRARHLARLRSRRHQQRSAGVDVGITAARNFWISIGYNFAGFRDEHFDANRYTAEGPYVRFRFKVGSGHAQGPRPLRACAPANR